ncbi:SMI1/KNR4 family protein [Kitasatospora arboriphila]|uniref:Knr4/Smi1-like domain-containing protein n=1 Tax=Kitasatospora arboriphila TaxID=258052 RepID=A0ABN1TTD7_9ACTN
MTQHPEGSVTASWRRIDAWPAVHAPAASAALRPPAGADAVEAAERALDVPFPAELRESLGCHDGATGWTGLLPEQSPLGAADIAEHGRMRLETAAGTDGLVTRPWDDEPWWHPLWVPRAESADGGVQVIDLRPGPGSGRLGWAGHSGGGDFSGAWPGLAAYLHEVSRALWHGGGVRGTYRPYLTADGDLWWDCAGDRPSPNGEPLTPAPVGPG